MPRTILIVDDNEINRIMLRRILASDYTVIEAVNGKEALEILNKAYREVSAIMLDIVMPVMDGYTVLQRLNENAALSQIPVIVTTGITDGDAEVKALRLGANDFIAKPYVPDVIKQRLQNTIELRETAMVVNVLQKDELTGILNSRTFFEKASELIKEKPEGYYILSCIDIDSFKLVNDQYGTVKGDEVLVSLARTLNNLSEANGGICGRINADDFIALFHRELAENGVVKPNYLQQGVLSETGVNVTLNIGRYLVDDKQLEINMMYDRAIIAQNTIKGRYDINFAYYDDTMRKSILREQEIVNDMKLALSEKRFEVWFQPQYNHSTGALIGAEALVRWRHQDNQLVAPNAFIPIFEKNGFVYELDKYVWEECCVLLRKWLDEGRNPLPISVNISRYDLLRAEMCDVIIGLIQKYLIPFELLRLEITESAFAKNPVELIAVVKRLISYGFTVEIDDFGSGYSSLNTLKDVPAQILKMDMRFLESNDNSGRGGNILESVVRMAKRLDMSVIAEGVETRKQADYLSSIGCDYIQGYLYAKPMPVSDYESLARNVIKEDRLITLETLENLNNNSFWDPSSMDTLIFNSYVGTACVFEYENEHIELLRVSQKFAKLIRTLNISVRDALKLEWSSHLDGKGRKLLKDALEISLSTGEGISREIILYSMPHTRGKLYIMFNFRVIATTGTRYLVYCTYENITAQREAEKERIEAVNKESKTAERMRFIMENINGGISAITIDESGNIKYIFANDRFYSILGYTEEEFIAEVGDATKLVHPDDLEMTTEYIERAIKYKKTDYYECRCRRRDGSIVNLRCNITGTTMEGIKGTVLLSIITDITALVSARKNEKKATEQMQAVMDNIDCGVFAIITDGTKLDIILSNDRYYELFGYTREQFNEEVKDNFELIHPDDRERVIKTAMGADTVGRTETLSYRHFKRDHSEMWVKAVIATKSFEGTDKPVKVIVVNDITEEKLRELRILSLNENLRNMMDDMPGGFARLRVMPDGSLSTVYVNTPLCAIRGMSREEIIGDDHEESLHTVHPDDRESVRTSLLRMLESQETCKLQYRLLRGDGSYVKVDVFGRISVNVSGASYINAYYTEMTDNEKREFDLKSVVPHVLSAIMQYSTDLVFAKDKDFKYICCSPAFVKFTRQESEADVIGRDDYDFWTKEEADHFRGDDIRLFEGGEALVDFIEVIPSDDGIQHFCSTSKYLLRDSTGEVIGMYGIGRDITDEKMNYEHLKLLTDSIPGGIVSYICTPDEMRIVYYNDGFCKIFGYTREEFESIIARNAEDLVFEDDIQGWKSHMEEAIREELPLDYACRVYTKTGKLKWVNIKGRVAGREKDICTLNAVVYDVTVEKEADEESLIHQQEMQIAISQFGRMYCEYDIKTKTLSVPKDYAKLYELPSGTVENVPDSLIEAGIIDEDTVVEFKAFYEAIINGEKSGSVDYREIRSDGSLHWENAEFTNVFKADGTPYKAIITVSETTKQHLQQELELNRPIIDKGNLICRALYNLSRDNMVLEYYDKYRNSVPKEYQINPFGTESEIESLIPDEKERSSFCALYDTQTLLSSFNNGAYEHSIEYRRAMYGEKTIWARNNLYLMKQPGGDDILLFDYCYAIDEKQVRERELNDRLKAILNSVNGGMSVTRLTEGRVEYIFTNKEFYSIFGYTEEQYKAELLNGMRDIIYDGDLEAFEQAIRETEEKGVASVDVRCRKRNGELIWVNNASSIGRIDGFSTPVYIVVSRDVTKEKQDADNLRMSEEQFRVAATAGGRVISRYDFKTGIYSHNDPVLLALGYESEVKELPEKMIASGVIAPESVDEYLDFYKKLFNGEKYCSVDTALKTADNTYRWFRREATTVFDFDGNPSQAIIVIYDITQQREKDVVYKRWQQSLKQRMPESYSLFRCNLSNDRSQHSFEGSLLNISFSAGDISFDERTREYAESSVLSEDREAYETFLKSEQLFSDFEHGNTIKSIEYREIVPSGELRWRSLTVELAEYPNSKELEAYLLYEDIHEQKTGELLNKERAETDPLTGILNRAAFAQAVENMITGSEKCEKSSSFALMMLDIDSFKLINDTFGHAMGDQVLVDIANSLGRVIRSSDALGRLGGDEFMICLRDMPDDEVIAKKAEQICRLLERSLSLEVRISTSVGIAVYPRDGVDFDTLYRKMDTALYAVKEHGKNNFAFFNGSMTDEYTQRIKIEEGAAITTHIEQKKKRRLLIVDDSEISLVMLTRLFEEEYIIETAKDGYEALSCLRHFGAGIAVVLLDLVMPGMNGFEVLEKMRENAEMRMIPVIIVSGMDEQETSLRVIKCGAADFVTKPVNPELIRLRVQSAISKAENDHLRTQNGLLLMHNSEIAKYRTALESMKMTVIEYDPIGENFYYDATITSCIKADFDDRDLWDILAEDGITTQEDAEKLKKLISNAVISNDEVGSITIPLMTPKGSVQSFTVRAGKRKNTSSLPPRVIITLRENNND